MNNALEIIKSGKRWDSNFNLPVLGGGNNPWIYMGYIDLALRINGTKLDAQSIFNFFEACRVPGKKGLFYRRPGGEGGPNSHDEVMGLFSLLSSICKDETESQQNKEKAKKIMEEVLNQIDSRFGGFNTHGIKTRNIFRYNIYRMIWLRGFLVSCIPDRKPGFFWTALWCLRIKSGIKNPNKSHRPRIMNWLMAAHITQKSKLASNFWKKCLEAIKVANTLQGDLSIEPGWPELTKIAPKEYIFPERV